MIEISICVLAILFVIWLFLWLMFSEGDTYTIGGSNVTGVLINEYTNDDGYDNSNGGYVIVKGPTSSKMVRELPDTPLPKIRANDYGGYEVIDRH